MPANDDSGIDWSEPARDFIVCPVCGWQFATAEGCDGCGWRSEADDSCLVFRVVVDGDVADERAFTRPKRPPEQWRYEALTVVARHHAQIGRRAAAAGLAWRLEIFDPASGRTGTLDGPTMAGDYEDVMRSIVDQLRP